MEERQKLIIEKLGLDLEQFEPSGSPLTIEDLTELVNNILLIIYGGIE